MVYLKDAIGGAAARRVLIHFSAACLGVASEAACVACRMIAD
jgi:hypothetical protein